MEIINSTLYQLDNAASRELLIRNAREQVRSNGAAIFPQFITEEALNKMVTEAQQAFQKAYRRDILLGINPKDGLESDKSLNERTSPYRMWSLASDLLEPSLPLQLLYRSPELIELIRDIVQESELHCIADPLINATVTYMGNGDQQGWHFDDNDFVVSLLLQKPLAGGEFEYVPNATGMPPREVESIVNGSSTLVKKLPVHPGTLILFKGRHALHRVAPVIGERRRVMALLSYHTEPGFIYSDFIKENSLGRTQSVQV